MSIAAMVFGWLLKLVLVGIVGLYSGLVVVSYATDGAHYPLRLDPEQPARSVEQILVWSGVKLLDWMLRMLQVVWNLLAEASADVGEWFLSKRSLKVQAQYRSRFL